MTLGDYLNDLRTVGLWTPVRVGYEVSRRTGLTGRLLTWRARHVPTPTLSPPFPELEAIPPAVVVQNQQEADRIRSGSIPIFDRIVQLDDEPDWFAAGAGQESWPVVPWWHIRLHSSEDRDVKWVWELGRHRHLVVLARAVATSDAPEPYLDTLHRHLRSWLKQNPPELGVHWYSNLELALRAIAWLQVLSLVGDKLDPEVRAEVARHLYHSCRHMVAELPYTLSSMRNNHLVGDAVGLVAIGKAFPGDRAASKWVSIGDRLLRWHLPKHVAEDGSSVEDSLGYRCFVLELLAIRVLLGDAPEEVNLALRLSADHLGRLGVNDGEVPRFGDWDGGHVLVGSMAALSPERTLRAVLAITGGGAADDWRETQDAIAWYAGPGEPAETRPAVEEGSDVGGHLGRITRGPWTVWLKAGAGPSHGHADLLSVTVRHRDQWLVADPGNGSYNRSLEERDYFRKSVAHSVLRLQGLDQREPHRRFRWKYDPNGELGACFELGEYRVMWGRHDAYRRLRPQRTIMRACLVSPSAVVVADWVNGEAAEYQLSIPLHPDVVWDGKQLVLPNGQSLGLTLPETPEVVRGSHHPYDGWWADTYDLVRPTTRIEITGHGSGPIVWALWEKTPPALMIDGDVLVVDGEEIYPGPDDSGLIVLLHDRAKGEG